MKLYEFKTRYLAKLALYVPKSDRERELRDLLINRLHSLRSMVMPYFIHTLFLIIERENVSEDFKEICKNMVKDSQKIVEEDLE